MSGPPATGAGSGPEKGKIPSDRTSGDAKTVWTGARLERSPLKSERGPVDSPHPAAVSTSAIQVISLMRLDLYLPLPRQPRLRHNGLERLRSDWKWGVGGEAPVGIEPTNRGFADLCLTTWLRRRGRQKSPKHLGFSTPQSFHQLCGPRQHLLILHRKMGAAPHPSLTTPRPSLLEKALARRRRLDQLHPTIFGVTNPAHQPAPL